MSTVRVLELGGSDPKALGNIVKTLAVRYYVDGTYQRVGDDIRVAARLVNADAGTIAVQESRTDRFANLLQLQDDLSRRFAAAPNESPGVRVKRTASLAAYQSVAEANDLASPNDLRPFDVTRDGKFVVLGAGGAAGPQQTDVVLNWTEELKRRVPTN